MKGTYLSILTFTFIVLGFTKDNSSGAVNCKIAISDSERVVGYFSTNANISKIQINKEDPTDVQSKIRISWECSNCTHVYIKGLDTLQHSASGSFEIDDPAYSYTIIGVTKNSVFSKEISGTLAYKRGTGIDGRIYFIKNDLSAAKKKSWQYFFTSKKTFQEMIPLFTTALQDFNYVSESNMEDPNTLEIECEPMQSHQLLCSGADCSRKIGERRIERKLGLLFIIQKKGDMDFQLSVTPTVMMNYPLQDKEWRLDPDEYSTSKKSCDEISKKILEKL